LTGSGNDNAAPQGGVVISAACQTGIGKVYRGVEQPGSSSGS
jgi:hypothetical protein